MLRYIIALIVLLTASAASARADDEILSIDTTKGRFQFSVELAETPEQRAVGLMFRTTLDPDAAMLFDFGKTAPVSMWMKNTLIPLDMLFITRDGTIANIIPRAVPGSLNARSSSGPVWAVLEVNGGTAERLGIRAGDRISHPLFGSSE